MAGLRTLPDLSGTFPDMYYYIQWLSLLMSDMRFGRRSFLLGNTAAGLSGILTPFPFQD